MKPTLVVIPTYNEAATIEEALLRVRAAPVQVDVLVVDDNSPDGTARIVQELGVAHPGIHLLERPRQLGLGSAYRAGLGWGLDAGYEVLVEMDGDLSHDPGQLPGLLKATERADVVIGCRYMPGGEIRNWAWHRRLLSRAGNAYTRLATGMPLRDATSGFRAYRRAVLEELNLDTIRSEGYSFQVEMALRSHRAGFLVYEVPITFVERRAGASKISRSIVLEALWKVLQWSLRGPRRTTSVHSRSVVARD